MGFLFIACKPSEYPVVGELIILLSTPLDKKHIFIISHVLSLDLCFQQVVGFSIVYLENFLFIIAFMFSFMDWDQSRDLKVWFFWRYYVVVLIQVGELQICICPAPTYMWGQRMLSTFLIFNPIFWRFTYSIALASNKESGLPKIWFSVIYSISSLNRGGTNCFRGKWWLAENKKDNGT